MKQLSCIKQYVLGQRSKLELQPLKY